MCGILICICQTTTHPNTQLLRPIYQIPSILWPGILDIPWVNLISLHNMFWHLIGQQVHHVSIALQVA